MFDFLRKKPVEIEKRDINLDVDTETPSAPFALNFYKDFGFTSSLTLSAVFAAVELISNSLASLPIHIRDLQGNIIQHPLDSVFANSQLTKFTLIKQLIVDMLINGNGIAYINRDKNGRPSDLIYMPKGMYTINFDNIKRKITYDMPSISSRPVLPKDVIHILKNSTNGFEGKGLMAYAKRILGIASAAENQAENFFSSGCNIQGILKSSKHLSKKQQQEIQQSWNNAHSGISANGLAVLPVDIDYIKLGSSAADSQLLESRVFSIQEIARYFSISPVLLQDLSHSSYSTLEASQLEFLVHTLQPYIEILQDEFNRKLVPERDVVIDWDEMHLLLSDKQSMAGYLSTMVSSGILSINECRHFLGYEDIPGGDEHVIAYTDINQNTIGKSSEEDSSEDDDK